MNTFLGAVGTFLVLVGAQAAAVTPLHASMVLLGLCALVVGFGRELFS